MSYKNTKTTKQLKKPIEIGTKKHYLTIISKPFCKNGRIYYEATCDCGEKTVIQGVRFGRTKSCGCLVGEREKPLMEIPNELTKMKSKFVRNGKLLVFEDGTIFRVKGNFYFRARQFFVGGRETSDGYDAGYPAVTYNENGKQIHKTVHRLVGKAFLKRKEGANEINHKDGNKENNHASNLEWVTRQENTVHAYSNNLIRTLENTPHQCLKCKGPTMRRGEICSECKLKQRQLKESLQSKQKHRDLYRDIDISVLKPIYKRIIRSRFQGFTLESIGEELGFTREYVRQLEKRVFDKDPIVYNEKEINSAPLIEETPNILVDFRITLRAARVNSDLTTTKTGELIGRNATTVTNWERGRTKIPINDFKRLVKLYNVPISLLSFKRDGNWIILEEEAS